MHLNSFLKQVQEISVALGFHLRIGDEAERRAVDAVAHAVGGFRIAGEHMPQIVAYIYNIEHAAPMTFIGENSASESYVVGMTCTRGRFSIPGAYKAEDGKLTDLSAQ